MAYSRKFHRLVEVLNNTTTESVLAKKAAALQVEIAERKKTVKAAYFELLREGVAVNLKHYDYLSSPQAVRNRLTSKHSVGLYLNKITYELEGSPSKQPLKLVTPEESMFVFLRENVEGLRLDKQQKQKLDEIIKQFTATSVDQELLIEDANWQIAQIVFQKLQQAKNKEASLCTKILIGYLINSPSAADIATRVESLRIDIAPLSFTDYLFYRMTDAAFEAAPAKKAGFILAAVTAASKKAPRGPFNENTLWDGLLELKKRHTDEQPVHIAYPVRRNVSVDELVVVEGDGDVKAAALVTEQQNHLPRTYDMTFNQYSPFLIAELNKHFQHVKTSSEKAKLKQFVKDLSTLDANVRELQTKMDILEDTQRPADDMKTAFQETIKAEVFKQRKQIVEQATKLHRAAANLFYQGKNSSTWRIILGIGLLIIGTALIAAGAAALILVPPILAGLPATALGLKVLAALGLTAAQLNILSGVSVAAGMGTLIGSAACFFQGTSRQPSNVATAVNNTLTVCEESGKEALGKIERYVPSMS